MAVDTFICGVCGLTFHEIELFIVHKKSCEQNQQNEALQPEQIQPTETEQEMTKKELEPTHVEMHVVENTDPSAQQVLVNAHSIIATISEDGCIIATENIPGEGDQTGVDSGIQLVPVQADTDVASELRVVVRSAGEETPVTPKPPGRKRGRPRKGEEKNPKIRPKSPPKVDTSKLKQPERGKDGKIQCQCCKKSFLKERHFITHKCLASSDYVDITKRETIKMELGEDAVEELPEDDDEEEEEFDADDTAEFKINMNKKIRLEKQQKQAKNSENNTETEEAVGFEKEGTEDNSENKSRVQKSVSDTKIIVPSCVTLMTNIDQVADVPVFTNEEDKIAFEDSLNVDLSGIDHMFKVHVIEQDVNENAPPPASRTSNELCIYSCNTCDKVFKTISHMRLHCLTHTNLKPFKCIQCSYASNSKGNLYTHMRKHTGQFYRCGVCEFKTVNKSHLVEHEATHSGVKEKCEICHKNYNTIKSLINHVRKYHKNSKKGKQYLDSFQGKHSNGVAVLHQCHVCNRKFKKKIDRDRHLFVHNIRDNPNVFACELCDYTSSRRIYLEKHFRKHRVVYKCSECTEKFLSTIRLTQHLQNSHLVSFTDERWQSLFESCINNSVFLPEPDGSVAEVTDGEELYVNSGEDALETQPSETEAQIEDTMEGELDAQLSGTEAQTEDAIEGELETQPSETEAQTEDAMEGEPQPETEGEEAVQSISDVSEKEISQPMEDEDSEIPPLVAPADINENVEAESMVDSQTTAQNVTETVDEQIEESSSGGYDIYQKLEFKTMSMDVLQKLRTTFGSEECEFCGRLFYSKTDFEPHFRTHTGEKPFACDQCDYCAVTKDNLKRHIQRDHEHVRFICRVCDYEGSSRTQLWNHEQKHREPAEVECPECQAKFDSKKKLRSHLTFKHPDAKIDDVLRSASSNQKPQGKLGRKSYKCPYCDRTFLRAQSDLEKHIWIHEGIKPFQCPVCPHACRSKNNLAAHMLRHSAEKPFLCNVCGKGYKSKTALRWHVRMHKDGKIFKCDRCPYEAVQRSHLKRHMETHDIIKKFMCEHCDYSANTLGYMKIHYTRNHKGAVYSHNPVIRKATNVETRVYKCLSCDYLFGNLSDMKRHLKIRHNIQVEDINSLDIANENFIENGDVSAAQFLPVVVTEEQIPDTQVQLVQMVEGTELSSAEEVGTSTMQALQYTTPGQMSVDEKAVNIIQQIIDMQNQGAFTQQQQITVQSDDSQSLVAVNPETIIVQQEGEEVVVACDGEEINENQYVIQYITPDGQIVQGSSQAQLLETVASHAEISRDAQSVVEDIIKDSGFDGQLTESTDVPQESNGFEIRVSESSNMPQDNRAFEEQITQSVDTQQENIVFEGQITEHSFVQQENSAFDEQVTESSNIEIENTVQSVEHKDSTQILEEHTSVSAIVENNQFK